MRKPGDYKIFFLLFALVIACVKPFEPPAIKLSNQYLVVDGAIGIGSNTAIRLSRTHNLADTTSIVPENNAQVQIEGKSGESFPLEDSVQGYYITHSAAVVRGNSYRLRIITGEGKEYLSDYVEAKQTPEIDSLQWNQEGNVFIYLNAHDPSNNTRYYRWDFVETSEYTAAFDSHLDFKNGEVIFIEPEDYRYTCYKNFNSTDLLLGSSAALSEDVISHQLIATVPNDNSKISVRYSILIRQYAITAEAYQYFQIVKQSSQQTGGIFDPQPSQIRGNIHCITDPQEPVIGFVTACSVAEKRLFIRNADLKDRMEPTISVLCKEQFVARDSAAYFLSDGLQLPAYFISNGPLAIVPNFCVDCRLKGGVTTKPSFW